MCGILRPSDRHFGGSPRVLQCTVKAIVAHILPENENNVWVFIHIPKHSYYTARTRGTTQDRGTVVLFWPTIVCCD